MDLKPRSLARPPPPLPAGGAKTARSRAQRIMSSSSSLSSSDAVSSPLTSREWVVMFDLDAYALPAGEWMRRRQASKEVLKRALSPPKRRPSLRWRNFQPRPSPLSIMSTA